MVEICLHNAEETMAQEPQRITDIVFVDGSKEYGSIVGSDRFTLILGYDLFS